VSKRLLLAGLVAIWSGLIGIGAWAMMRWESTPGEPGDAPQRWPQHTALVLASDHPTLVVLAHPRCVCTEATLGELARLLRLSPTLRATVVFSTPDQYDPAWSQSPIVEQAKKMAGVTVVEDPGGAETVRFGGLTSGTTLAYSESGQLLYSGGITRARGLSGDNPGFRALVSALGQGRPELHLPTYGCLLFRESTEGSR